MGMTFQAFRGSSGAQIAFTILLATSIGDRVTQCTAHERGVANAVKVGQNHFFLENKVVVNFNFRHGAKKSGQSDHSFRSYGFFQWKSKMKEFTNVTIPVQGFHPLFHESDLAPLFHPLSALSLKETTLSGWKWCHKMSQNASNHAPVHDIQLGRSKFTFPVSYTHLTLPTTLNV